MNARLILLTIFQTVRRFVVASPFRPQFEKHDLFAPRSHRGRGLKSSSVASLICAAPSSLPIREVPPKKLYLGNLTELDI